MAATPSVSTYAVEPGDVARDREAVLATWRGNLGQDARMQAKYDWFYAHCPFGEPTLRLLRHAADDTIVGAAAAGPRRFVAEGKTFDAGVLVDLAVSPQHRSLGPALMLQAALAEAGGQRFGVLYGFPNPKAAAVFKRVGYEKFGDIVRHARVLRHASYVQRRLPRVLAVPGGWLLDRIDTLNAWWRRRSDARLQSRWSDRTDPRFDSLWARSPSYHAVTAVRDATFTRWRFDDSPLANTRYLLVEDANGTLDAWFACQDEDGLLHVRDFWSEHGNAGVARAHVDALLRAARQQRVTAVSVEFGGSEQAFAGWAACGFIERSRRPVFGRWSNPDAGQERRLYLTSADEDE